MANTWQFTKRPITHRKTIVVDNGGSAVSLNISDFISETHAAYRLVSISVDVDQETTITEINNRSLKVYGREIDIIAKSSVGPEVVYKIPPSDVYSMWIMDSSTDTIPVFSLSSEGTATFKAIVTLVYMTRE